MIPKRKLRPWETKGLFQGHSVRQGKNPQSVSSSVTFAALPWEERREWGWSGREILNRGAEVSPDVPHEVTAVFKSQVARRAEGEGMGHPGSVCSESCHTAPLSALWVVWCCPWQLRWWIWSCWPKGPGLNHPSLSTVKLIHWSRIIQQAAQNLSEILGEGCKPHTSVHNWMAVILSPLRFL